MTFIEKKKIVMEEVRKVFQKAKWMNCAKNEGRNDSIWCFIKIPFPSPAISPKSWNEKIKALRKNLCRFGVTSRDLPCIPNELYDDGSGYQFVATFPNATQETEKTNKFSLKVFINCGEGDAVLRYPEYKRMPSDCAKLIRTHIRDYKANLLITSICTCSDIPVSVVGEMIGEKVLKSSEVKIVYDGKTYRYDDKGYLDGNWPYGVFSISSPFSTEMSQGSPGALAWGGIATTL